jgi:alpha-L-glutamate ligase-like protein
MWNWLRKSREVLGMNARNLEFIQGGGSKRARRLVDSKLATKKVLIKAGLPVAKIIGKIKNWQEFSKFDWTALPKSFVLKPNRGLGGEGIMVTFGRRKNGEWVLPQDRSAKLKDIVIRTANILDGDFSLTQTPDIAFFEERIKIHPAFKLYSYKGVPDIRIIVYNKVPVMSMLRLPTRESNGKANLHAGGIGLGIDISTGRTTHAVFKNKMIDYLPGTVIPLRGLQIPEWDELLRIAIESQIASGLTYVGADLALDREVGPIVMELNARPGLSIQNANLAPLKDRLLRVKGLKIKTVKRAIKIAKDLFGGEIEQEIEGLSGKKVVGIIEKIKIKGKTEEILEVEAKIDTGAVFTSIDEGLAIKLGFGAAVDYYKKFNIAPILNQEEINKLSSAGLWQEVAKHEDIVDMAKVASSHGYSYRIEVPVKIWLGEIEIEVVANVINREHLRFPIIVGRRDLKRFLVDPTKNI